jgi:uncharacterized protein (TIGR02757 family)
MNLTGTAGKVLFLIPKYKWFEVIDLKQFLEEKYLQYNTTDFIAGDPVAVPHQFAKTADIEIAGFLTAIIAWGRRETIARAGNNLMHLMGNEPAGFVKNASKAEITSLGKFVYRTFNGFDAQVFVDSLRCIHKEYGTLENAFFSSTLPGPTNMAFVISRFKKRFFGMAEPGRSGKHISDPLKNSAAKRINMFLRWMVRSDEQGVDFGIWKMISPSHLICPLDLHSGRVARGLGLLTRKQNDWKAALELTKNLRQFDPDDPVKYDFALFGLGWYEKF